ncbi:MAG: uroporphyrinogen decarboxylase family protein [Calditrichia bacterium]
MHNIDAAAELDFVMDAIKLVRNTLDGKVPLIGFSGAPWTLATYMIEGSGSKNFKHIKEWRYARPDLLHKLLHAISDAVIDYCRAKINAGAQAIQIFDSWAGIFGRRRFQ